MSRKPHKPTRLQRRTVQCLAGLGVRQDQIGNVIGISVPTLHRAYRAELDAGSAHVEAELIGSLMRLTRGDGPTALRAIIFVLRCRFGWKYASEQAPVPTIGKKEAANLEARTAHEGSDWGDLIN
jgi:hypothetical protein